MPRTVANSGSDNVDGIFASGAGHDCATFANQGVPCAMIFVRNEHGSHNPDEALALEDFAVATRALLRLLVDFPL